jgi:hypothetical protein
VKQWLVTEIAVADQDRLHTRTMQCSLQAVSSGREATNCVDWASYGWKTNSDQSPRALVRLLIDEIVEDLSQSGSGCESRSVQKPNLSLDAIGLRPGHDVDATVNFLA